MKYFLTPLFIVLTGWGFSQINLEPNKKYYYGVNHFIYKDSIKGQLGEAQINIFKLTDSTVVTFTYHRFIYNLNDISEKILAPIGEIFVEKNNYSMENNFIQLPHYYYKYFIFNNEAKDTLSAYINDEFLKNNISDIYREISVEEIEEIIDLQ